jgi:hypothetical protein
MPHAQRQVMYSIARCIVELANEPHTRDSYEWNQGGTSGRIVREWIYEMAAYVRSIDYNHMVRRHNAGYMGGTLRDPTRAWSQGSSPVWVLTMALETYLCICCELILAIGDPQGESCKCRSLVLPQTILLTCCRRRD